MTDDKVRLAKKIYAEKEKTAQEIADVLNVSRTTVHRYLEPVSSR